MNPSATPRHIPYARLGRWGRTIGSRRLTAGLVVVVGALSVVAMSLSLAGRPGMDVRLERSQSAVSWVLPGGSSWAAGVRAGQRVASFHFGSDSSQWTLVTKDGSGVAGSSAAAVRHALLATWPWAVAAAFLVLLALVAVARSRRLAGSLALLAFGCTWPTFRSAGDSPTFTLLLTAAPLLAAGWLATLVPRPYAALALGSAITAAVLWAVARLWSPVLFPTADTMWLGLTVILLVAGLWSSGSWTLRLHDVIALDPPLAVDLGALAVIIGVAAVALVVLSLPLWAVVLALVGTVAVYPRIRHRLGGLLEEALFGSLRTHASTVAAEEERARLAGEIHDGPLQELAAVIGRLDDSPDMAHEASVLRDVAAELRGVTTALRPPVLDDLGLGAAIAFLVDETRRAGDAGPTVQIEVEDRTEVGRGVRPPREVELAAFRIVQEALNNALLHAAASRIAISGEISPSHIRLIVSDNGRGLHVADIRNARRRGHLGLGSMRQRASVIGAELTIGPGNASGTQVDLLWNLS